jgi:hypothetical protein
MLRFVCLSVLLAGCAATTNQLKQRAAYDLRCSEAAVEIIDMDSRTNMVVGCGKQALYTSDCQSQPLGPTECTWKLDPTSVRDAPEPGTEGGLCKRISANAYSCHAGLLCQRQQCVREP